MGRDAPDVEGVAAGPLVLIVADDPSLAELLEDTVGRRGFRTVVATAGTEAVRIACRQRPHLVLLGLVLPGLSGPEVCRMLRQHPTTRDLPVIMLGALDEKATTVHGLDAGADDYGVRPFSPAELVARMRAVLRRSAARPAGRQLLSAGPLAMDLAARTVRCGDRTLRLSATAFALLRHFLGGCFPGSSSRARSGARGAGTACGTSTSPSTGCAGRSMKPVRAA